MIRCRESGTSIKAHPQNGATIRLSHPTRLNRLAGDALRDEIAAALTAAGRTVEIEQVFKTPFGPRRVDIVVYDELGKIAGFIETKLGNSPYSPAQRAKDMYLWVVEGIKTNVVREKQIK